MESLTNSGLRTYSISPTASNNHVSMKENPSPVRLSDDTSASVTTSSHPVTDPEAEDMSGSLIHRIHMSVVHSGTINVGCIKPLHFTGVFFMQQ